MEELLKHWDIGPIGSVEPLDSFTGKVSQVRTDAGQVFILKEEDDQEKAEREAGLLQELAAAGAPVAVPVRTTAGNYTVLEGGKVFLLYPQLQGEAVKEHYEGDAAGRAAMFGRTIASLHGWLSNSSSAGQFPRMDLLEQIRQWALPCFKTHRSVKAVEALEVLWGRLESDWAPLYEKLPRQLIHRDAHPGNMLFEQGRLTGFIDFDQSMEGPRLFDLCYCGTALLAGGFPEVKKRNAWPGLFRALVRGYETVRPLSPTEREAIPGMLIAIEFLFAAFFLEIGDPQAARKDERVIGWLAKNRSRIQL